MELQIYIKNLAKQKTSYTDKKIHIGVEALGGMGDLIIAAKYVCALENILAQTSLLTFYATIRIYVIKMSFSPKIQYIQKKMPRIMTCIFPLSVSLLLKTIYQIV